MPDRPRNRRKGILTLEALTALTILAVVLVAGWTALSRALAVAGRAEQGYQLAALSRAVLEEYTLTYPDMPSSGVYAGRWTWRVQTELTTPNPMAEMQEGAELRTITVIVTDRGWSPLSAELGLESQYRAVAVSARQRRYYLPILERLQSPALSR